MQLPARRRVAVFVDFDNAYSGLRERSLKAAEMFGLDPGAWLRWLEEGMPASFARGGLQERAILVRKCYLNPDVYRRHRSCFTEAGFQVVDCPTLTGNGKTSADMLMVLEIMDALQREMYDEFVIFSGDADFTPILLRLRGHDRRTTVVATGNYARVMHGAADVLIDCDLFMRFALKVIPEAEQLPPRASEAPASRSRPQPPARPGTPASPSARVSGEEATAEHAPDDANARDEAAIMEFLRRCVSESAQPLSLSDLGSRVRSEYPSVGQTRWFGRGGFGSWLRSRREPWFTVFSRNGGAYLRLRDAPTAAAGSARSAAPPRRPSPPAPRPRPADAAGADAQPPLSPPADPPADAGSPTRTAGSEPPTAFPEPQAESAGPVHDDPPLSPAPAPHTINVDEPPAEPGATPPRAAPDAESDPPAPLPYSAEPEVPAAEAHDPRPDDSAAPDASAIPGPAIDPANPHTAGADTPYPEAVDGVPAHPVAPFEIGLPRAAPMDDADHPDECSHPLTADSNASGEVARPVCEACGAARRPGHPRCLVCGTPV